MEKKLMELSRQELENLLIENLQDNSLLMENKDMWSEPSQINKISQTFRNLSKFITPSHLFAYNEDRRS